MDQLLRIAKSFASRRFNASARISLGPTVLLSAHLVATDVGAAIAALHDGESIDAEVKVDLSAPASEADPRSFNPPMYFDRGIYLDVGSNVRSVMVQIAGVRRVKQGNGGRSVFSYLTSWMRGSTEDPKST